MALNMEKINQWCADQAEIEQKKEDRERKRQERRQQFDIPRQEDFSSGIRLVPQKERQRTKGRYGEERVDGLLVYLPPIDFRLDGYGDIIDITNVANLKVGMKIKIRDAAQLLSDGFKGDAWKAISKNRSGEGQLTVQAFTEATGHTWTVVNTEAAGRLGFVEIDCKCEAAYNGLLQRENMRVHQGHFDAGVIEEVRDSDESYFDGYRVLQKELRVNSETYCTSACAGGGI